MANFNVPQGKQNYSTQYEKFRGVDYSTDPALIDASRSPFAPNLISDAGGMPEKRLGWRTLFQLPQKTKINGIFTAEINGGSINVLHCGTTIYKWEQTPFAGGERKPFGTAGWTAEGTYTALKENITDGKSCGFVMNDKLYILTGGEYLCYGEFENKSTAADGTETTTKVIEMRDVASRAYVPTIAIGIPPAGGGTPYEDVNLLTPKRKNSFLCDGSAATYKLDSKDIDAELLTAKLNDVEKKETTDFTVDRKAGTVTFKTTPPKSAVVGRDNLIITFAKTNEKYKNKIAKCKIATIYADRVFVSGNPAEQNTDYRSGFRDPSYFPDLGYSKIGSDTAIMGYAKIGEYLSIVKADNSQDSTIFMRSEGTMNNETVFPIKQGVTGAGAIATNSFGNILGEPLFLSRNGILGISSNNVTAEKAVQNRSYYIDAALTREKDMQNATACNWNGYYLLALNNVCYILDGRQSKSYRSQSMGDYLYECYKWENIPAVCWLEKNDNLYFGTADGRICRFNSDIAEMSKYNDDGAAIVCAWSTKADDDGSFTQYKNMTKRGCGVMIKPYLRSSVKIMVRTNKDFGREIRYATMDIFDWEDLDFERITFDANDAPRVVPFNAKVKKYITLQITVKNDTINEGFGVFGITKRFTRGNAVK